MNLIESTWFPTDKTLIDKRISQINVLQYAKTRNFLDGKVSYLSPYFTHGFLSTKDIAEKVLNEHGYQASEKFLFELAWREFFHHVWLHRGDDIFECLERPQQHIKSNDMPCAVTSASTKIKAIDDCLETLFNTGMMHNHARMWTASIVANMARTNWKTGAQWMYYHLMDGDLASNTLSWQWVAATFSNKPYVCNQENINRYARTQDQGTWLDVDYSELPFADIPPVLEAYEPLELSLDLSSFTTSAVPSGSDIALRHIWNLNPNWRKEIKDHVVLIEPSVLSKNPLSPKRLAWIQDMIFTHLPDAQILVGDFQDVFHDFQGSITYEAYPAISHWQGQKDAKTWMFDLEQRYFKRFFPFWNAHRKKAFGATK